MIEIQSILKKIGLNRAIGFTVIGKVLSIIGSIAVIYLISKYLSSQEQGYYYTFGSIVALQVFFELGLSYVIIHYASYETAWLTFSPDGLLTGDFKAKSRLASLLRFTIKWYLLAAFILLVLLIPVGLLFFSRNEYDNITWVAPWLLLATSTSLFLLITPILSFLEGCGKIKEVAFFRLLQSLINYLIIGLSLFFNFKLYALGIGLFVNFLLGVLWLSRRNNLSFLLDIWQSQLKEFSINWKKEIFPFQWKIAVSWLSGYLIFQFFNPILFTYQGAKLAGQMGMTLNAFSGISVLAMAWLNTKVPTFSVQIAKKEFQQLDKLFFSNVIQSSIVNVLFSLMLFLFIVVLQEYHFEIGGRFLPYKLIVFFVLNNLINHVVFCEAIYLRAHKEEPFLINSIVGAVLTAILIYISGKYFDITIMVVLNFFLIAVVGLPWGTYIFVKKRKLWHS